MDVLYSAALHEPPINGVTHLGIMEEIRERSRIKVSGDYGTMDDDTFVKASITLPFSHEFRGEELIDLDEQSQAAGRPAEKPFWELDASDIIAWLEEDPAVRQERIAARRAASEPAPEEE